jgi:hypothetical protein
MMLASLVSIATVCRGAQVVQESTLLHNNVTMSRMNIVNAL